MENPGYDYLFKILLVGGPTWGKSNILKKFTHDEFSEIHMSTIGLEFGIKSVEIDDKKVTLQIWDTAGQEKFKPIVS